MLLTDAVRLPIAARMKEKSLGLILAQMPPAEAKRLTESLANRFDPVRTAAAASGAAAPAAAPAGAPAPAAPGPQAAAPGAKPGPA